MTKTVTASKARNNFFAMLKEIETPGVSIVITYEGQPKGVLMSVDEFEGWMETLDIMSNPVEAAETLRRLRNIDKEKKIPFKRFKSNLGVK